MIDRYGNDSRIDVIYGSLSSMDLITKVISIVLWINFLSGKVAALLSIFMFSFTFVMSFEVRAVSFFIVCSCLYCCMRSNYLEGIGIKLTSFCTCPKSGLGCASAHVGGFVMFNDFRWELVVDICRIVTITV